MEAKQGRSGYAMARHIWVCEVTWMRRKGKPIEAVGITTGGMLQALFMAKELAERLKIPQSWVNPVLYKRSTKGRS
jgi:hypothetical protein